MAKRIRIVSDGTTAGTAVYDASGNILPNVVGVAIFGDVNDSQIIRATVQFDAVELDMVGEQED